MLEDPRPPWASDQVRINGCLDGRYFMMGDNRDNSNDSRGWGTVRPQRLQGARDADLLVVEQPGQLGFDAEPAHVVAPASRPRPAGIGSALTVE